MSIATNVANVYKVKAHSSETPALNDEVEMKVVTVKIESGTPEDIVCVGGTKSYTAVVDPPSVASEGTFAWSVNNPDKLGFVDGDTSSQTITVTGLVHSAGRPSVPIGAWSSSLGTIRSGCGIC